MAVFRLFTPCTKVKGVLPTKLGGSIGFSDLLMLETAPIRYKADPREQ